MILPNYIVRMINLKMILMIAQVEQNIMIQIDIIDTIEKEIVEVGELDPDQIHVSGVYVDRIVLIPEDGIFY